MSFGPIISVIMPVYNNALYIEEAVQSVLNQTFTDFECIIIDDASTDGTTAILKTLMDPRIKIIYFNENKGVSKATNEGFKQARGKYIARMDADDISVKERFEKQLTILENNPKIFICGSLVKYFGGSNRVIPYKETHPEILTELLMSCPVCMGASMFRKLELADCFYDETRQSGEDYDFWTKVAWHGELYNIQEVLLLYRVHPNQASIKYKPQQVIDDIDIKLRLFKKLRYDTNQFSDALLLKILLLNKSIQVNELGLFLKWLNELVLLNRIYNVYPNNEFKNVLKRIKRDLLFKLYFTKTNIGIDKLWRGKSLLKLDLKDALWVLNLKGKEIRKRIFKV